MGRAYYQFPLEDALVMKLSDIQAALAKVPPPQVNFHRTTTHRKEEG